MWPARMRPGSGCGPRRRGLCYAMLRYAVQKHSIPLPTRGPHEFCAKALRRQNNSAADARGMSCMRLFSVRAEESLKWSEVGCERRREQRESYRDAVAT